MALSSYLRLTFFLSAAASSAASLEAAETAPQAQVETIDAQVAHLPSGYIPRAELPDSLALLPPPPVPGSQAFARDEEARGAVQALRSNSERWRRAASDAVLEPDSLAADFSCAAGRSISKQATPQTFALLSKLMIDVGLSTYKAKDHYRRTRPFVIHQQATCAPADEALLRTDGSYPSGHSAIGWGWALILSELRPQRVDAILARGRDFGQSRLVCDAHWQSDIDAGRLVASTAIARLHADPEFRQDMEAARIELRNAATAPLEADCAAEAASLKMD